MRALWTPLILLRTLLLLLTVFCPAVLSANRCELKGCPEHKPGHINVHVLSHSHNDAGWYWTLDSMYSTVQTIYTGAMRALWDKPSRRYVSAENVFFSRWWNEQPADVRTQVRSMVQSGRLQFVGGGWVQNDEAVTHYTAIIDQMTLGLRFLNDTFGPDCGTPSVAWQADPFGHTIAQAALFARMGFSSAMIGRISWDTKKKLQAARAMEFVWEADSRQQGGDGGHILTWVPEHYYEAPRGLCSAWPPKDCTSEEADRSPTFLVEYAQSQAKVYTNDTVAVMAGCDMCYSYAQEQFARLDDVMEKAIPIAAKQNPRVHVVYSTPACYVQALHEASKTWPRFSDDLLPYSDEPGRTWTGFYTSRPNLKMMIRYANGFLQACKQLSLYGPQDASNRARQLGEAVATVQHHDGVTGTCSYAAAADYTNRMNDGIEQCEGVISTSLASLLNLGASDAGANENQLHFCHRLNMSECQHTETQREFTVIVYNPASVVVSPYVRLPLGTSDRSGVTVSGPDGARTDSQVVPVAWHGHGIPESNGQARTTLVFRANVEPLGASLYSVQYEAPVETPTSEPYFLRPDVQRSFIENDRYRVELNPQTGLISAVVLKGPGSAVQLRQAFAAYLMEPEGLEGKEHLPGHYTFGGYSDAREIGSPKISVVKGHLVQEIHQTFTGYISQVITLHKDSPFIEFTWTVGPLTQLMRDMGRNRVTGCDVISKFESDLQSDGFYTDNNGWRNMHRTLTFQDGNLPIPGNYHPVVSWIYIEDRAKDLQMMILPDRTEGGTSMRHGHLELMIHRRHSTNDKLGMPETLQEDGVDGEGVVARGTHRLFLGSSSEARKLMRLQALQLVYRPVILVSPGEWVPKKDTFSILKSPLPSTVHVLTLERLSEPQVLLRLEHLAVTDDTVEVNITRLLAGHRLEDVKPVTLGANQYLPGPARHSWPTSGADYSRRRVPDLNMPTPQTSTVAQTGDTVVKLAPGEIASFLAQLVAE